MAFTYHYKQPHEYQFCLDSIEFAECIAKKYENDSFGEDYKVLDLCAGCGVIGIELSWHLNALRHITFVEVQEIYTSYFKQNSEQVLRNDLILDWQLANYEILMTDEWKNQFNLIVSNPPYFFENHGMLSPSHFKNRCRFYLDSTFENYILAIANTLAVNGHAYFIMRPLDNHGINLLAHINSILYATNIKTEIIGKVRKSDVYKLIKEKRV